MDKYIALNQNIVTHRNIYICAFSKLNDQRNSLKWGLGSYLSKPIYNLVGSYYQ